jgi:predicted polyphosphate/ATP-dependent NAD kinase
MAEPWVGIIANPVSARDIRRVIANAASLQITDRANIVLRVLACLKACGIQRVMMMPEAGGIRGHVKRGLDRSANQGEMEFPELSFVDMRVTGTVEDSRRAASAMCAAGASAIVVLGGDGTHRAVASACGKVPLAGISTGTNNAFPEHREPTVTGLAVGLAVAGRIPATVAFQTNKRFVVSVNEGAVEEIALVDVAIVTERYVGARALWRTETFRELLVAFADPEVIGLSAIAGLLQPVSRREPGGLLVSMCPPEEAPLVLHAPIAPGYMRDIGILGWRPLQAGKPHRPAIAAGSIALDGERELSFSERDRVVINLEEGALTTIDVGACMHYAARHALMHTSRVAALTRAAS